MSGTPTGELRGQFGTERFARLLGLLGSAAEFGAFPTDPYSHTPAHAGAQKPGMTGPVKEEIITRFGELGVRVRDGLGGFEPVPLRRDEFLTLPATYLYVDLSGARRSLDFPAGGLAFTCCQMPVVHTLTPGDSWVRVVTADDRSACVPNSACAPPHPHMLPADVPPHAVFSGNRAASVHSGEAIMMSNAPPPPRPPSGPTLPEDLLQTMRAWQESRIVLSAIELDVFSAVDAGATSADVARRLGLDARGTDILLHAVAALGLLEKQGETFRNGPLADRHLRAGAPHDLRAALRHTAALWHRWSHLSEIVRTGRPAPRPQRDPADDESFIAAMHMNASVRAPHVVAALELSGARRALDLGGGSGAYAIAFARAVPSLRVDIVDTPDVTPLTRRYVAEAGLENRVTTREGDLRAGEYGEGYDLALLSAVCHMLGPEENADLIRRAALALGPGGRLVIQDFVLDPDRTSPRPAAVFAVNMLVNTAAGTNYTEADYFGWMRTAGLTEIRRAPLDAPTALVVGRRP